MTRDILLVGGTGTLGRALLKKLNNNQVLVFSRDELKQHELRHEFPGVETMIGDIRDPKSVDRAMIGINKVFHVAALKHVDVLEKNPYEAHQTNVIGTMNVAEAALRNKVQDFYFTSTDKAVLPINVYGMTKAIAERYLLNQNKDIPFSTTFKVFRWGNIVGSRGSAVNLFAKTLKEQGKVYITDERMTRFWMRIEDAVDFMLDHKPVNWNETQFINMKAAPVLKMAEAVACILGIDKFDVEICGIRPGEKLHECLYSSHNECVRSDTAPQLSLDELCEMVGPLLEAK